MGIFKNVGKGIINVAVIPAGNAISNLFKKGSGTATYENTFSSGAGQVYSSVLGASALSVAVATPAKLASKGIATGLTIVGGSALTSEKLAKKTTASIISLPSNLGNVGENIGKVVDNPSLTSFKELITENPVIVAGTTLAVAGGTALAIGGITSQMRAREATNDNTKAIKNSIEQVGLPAMSTTETGAGQTINIINQLPTTEPITPVKKTEPKPPVKKKKKKKAKKKSKKKKKKKKKKSTKKKKKKKSIKRSKT